MQVKTLPFIIIFIMSLADYALANDNSPIVFRQTTITIMSQREVVVTSTNNTDSIKEPPPQEAQSSDTDNKEPHTILQNVAYPFKVNMRRQRKKGQEWLQHQINIKRDRGLLIQLEPTDAVSLEYSDIYKNVDILLVRSTGVIDAIMPNIIPMNISETIITNSPINTIIYLHAGICEELGIMPNDNVKHDIFKPKSIILRSSKPRIIR